MRGLDLQIRAVGPAVTCGSAAVEATRDISADLFLLGVTGVRHSDGLTTGDSEEAAMKRALAGRAADTYVLASNEKIGAASRYRVMGLADVAGIITDAAQSAMLAELRAAGANLISVP